MATTKTFFGKLLATIVTVFGSIFKHVLSGAEKTYNELPQETKDALVHGVGMIDVINRMTGSTPDAVRAAITQSFPDVNEAALEKGLFLIAHGFNLLPQENNLDDCIKLLQEFLASRDSSVWEDIIRSTSNILAVFLAPAGTKSGALSTLIEYVYQTFFQKK